MTLQESHLNPLFRILLVEDELPHQRLFTRALSRSSLPAELVCMNDGKSAWDYLSTYKADVDLPTVVILDLNMPIYDGLEVLARIRMSKALHNLPVIVLSTSDEKVEIQRATALGCTAYLIKPIMFEEVERILGKLFALA
jgi:CheY-like chemotaxis protein